MTIATFSEAPALSAWTLGEYLKWALRQPWGWGTTPGLDCCKLAGKWAIVRGHLDPMILMWSVERPYDSELSALLAIKRGGGLVRLWSEGMAHVGIPEADDAREGDIGVIARRTQCGTDEAVAICTGNKWVTLGVGGLDFAPADVLASWRP